MRRRNGGTGARSRQRLSHRLSALAAALAFVSIGCTPPPASDSGTSDLQITLHPTAGSARPAYVAITGLSSEDLSSLRDTHFSDTDWQSLLRITIGDGANDVPTVIGKYAVTDQAFTFTPVFPFDPGRSYRVAFDPTRLPRPRQAALVTSIVGLPAIATTPTTVVTAVYPAADVVPENLLRMYIEFSAPMGSSGAGDFVRLVDRTAAKEKTVEGAFLPIEADFWSPDHTRYTLFLDPGRVKLGILPNRQSGRPLRAGHQYALEISARWSDANRQPLKSAYRHEFRAGPAVKDAIAMSDWRIAAPRAGTRDELVVTFPRPLDHAVLVRALGIETKDRRVVEGMAGLQVHDTRWSFVPAAAWPVGEYYLVALSFLEDPQGNEIGRPFEAVEDEPHKAPVPDAFRVAFTIAAPYS